MCPLGWLHVLTAFTVSSVCVWQSVLGWNIRANIEVEYPLVQYSKYPTTSHGDVTRARNHTGVCVAAQFELMQERSQAELMQHNHNREAQVAEKEAELRWQRTNHLLAEMLLLEAEPAGRSSHTHARLSAVGEEWERQLDEVHAVFAGIVAHRQELRLSLENTERQLDVASTELQGCTRDMDNMVEDLVAAVLNQVVTQVSEEDARMQLESMHMELHAAARAHAKQMQQLQHVEAAASESAAEKEGIVDGNMPPQQGSPCTVTMYQLHVTS